MSTTARGIIPRKIKGFRDITPGMNELRWKVVEASTRVYRQYGFRHWDTPVVEYADCLGKHLPDADTPEEGVYSFRNPESEPILDASGEPLRDEWNRVLMENHFLALRYDLTAPLARRYAEELWPRAQQAAAGGGKPKAPLLRRYQFGPVYRYEVKLAPGRFREFWQLDFDTVGVADPSCDAEVCLVLCDALEAIGLERGSYEVRVSSRKLIRGLFESLGVTGDEGLERDILRVVDKLDRIGVEGVASELGPGRDDQESGARVPGLGLGDGVIRPICGYVGLCADLATRERVLASLEGLVGGSPSGRAGLDELRAIHDVLAALGYGEERVVLDPSVARGLAYYTGPVFEAVSKLEYRDESGAVRRFGSIAGGGRYDNLVERLLGMAVPATGASIGVDRLCELLARLEGAAASPGPVLVTVLDPSRMVDYQRIAAELRSAGIATEVYYGLARGLKAQVGYADGEGCAVAIVAGGDEFARGTVSVKDLRLGKRLAAEITDRRQWEAQPAQVEVPRAEMVARVRAILAR